MENQYQRYVNITYLAVAALMYFLTFAFMTKLSGTYDLESHIKSIEFVIRGLAVVIGAGVFVGLYKSTMANSLMNEVVVELMSKVTWPTGKDTVSATIVVMITVILSGAVLAFFDWLFTVSLQGVWAVLQHVLL